MTKLILGLLMIASFAACSHMTPYEACNEVSDGSYEYMRYGTIEACVQQKLADREYRLRRSHAISKAFSDGYNGGGSSRKMICRPDYLGNLQCE